MSAGGFTALMAGGCSDENAYHVAVDDMTRPLPADAEARDLVRYATLAANGHNTQPWRFRINDRAIDILPDLSRRTPAVDPDDHHLFASLGCAAENLGLAARARGMAGEVMFRSSGDGATVDLSPAARREDALFAAIPDRQCSRVAYDGRSVTPDVVERLKTAASRYDVDTLVITEPADREDVLDLVVAGNSHQIDDPEFIAELKDWIRFNPDMALASRDGLYSGTSGNPNLPRWLGPVLFSFFFTKQAENDKYAEHIRSSAGIVIFVAATNDKPGWLSAGRAYERFALQATADGLKHAFINQPVEVPEIRRELQKLMGLDDRRPNLIVRFGYGPDMPRSLRRPVDDVIV